MTTRIPGNNAYSKWALTGQNKGTMTKKQQAQSQSDKQKFRAAQTIPAFMRTNNYSYAPASCLSHRALKARRPNKSQHLSRRDAATLAS